MPDEGFKRKLTAILSADIAGYSRLMAEDEAATVKTLATYREVMASLIIQHRGRVVDSPGDNVLAEFSSVVDAVQCAVAVQNEFQTRNAELAENRRMKFRIGINLGDVIDEEGHIYGDGVNVAARLEALADPGGICVSKTAFDQIETKLPLGYEYLGKQSVKNIPKPVRAYRVLMKPDAAGKVIGEKRFIGRVSRKTAVAAIIILVIVAVGLIGWNIYLQQSKRVEAASVENMANPLPDKPSFAVLPFDNMSGDPEQEFLSDGFTDTLIGGLSRIPDIFVIARTSTFSYKKKPATIKQVAEELGVQYVIEGSIQKSEDRLRVTVQMIDALTGYHVWSERYDRNIKDILQTQDDITFNIIKKVAAKHSRLREIDTSAYTAASAHTNSIDAYLKFTAAQHTFYQMTSPDSYAKAKQLCEEAIALDPNYWSPYMLLAWIHVRSARFGFSTSPEKSRDQALKMAKKAVELDESSALTHVTLCRMYRELKQFDKALAACKQGEALDPKGFIGLSEIGWLLSYTGRPEEAIPRFKKSARISPIAWFGPFGLGGANIFLGKYEDAIPHIKKAMDILPGYFRLHLDLAACYAALGREEEAKAATQQVLKIYPAFNVEKYIKNLPARSPEDIKYYTAALRKVPFPE
jgi:adenylate cyclase